MLSNFNWSTSIVGWLNDYAPQGIVVTDDGFIVCGWNRWLEQVTGRSAGDTLGLPLFDVFPEIVTRRLDRFYRSALYGQANVLSHRFHEYLVKLPAPEGSPAANMQQTARIAPLMQEGKVVGTITAIEDVTERVLRERELRSAREQAVAANEAKDRFLRMLSHDLRTPLSSILGWARVIRQQSQEALGPRVEQGLKSIERNAEIQLKLLEELLDVSRISTGKLQLEIENVDLLDALDAAVNAVSPIAEAKKIRVGRVVPEESRTAAIDPRRFQQITWNLLSNALKFTPEGGVVHVSLHYRTECFQISISDTGIGISEENISRIFEPLWQAGQPGGQGGLGIGLAIVHDVVRLHRGSIRAESRGVGKGTTFIVELPWSPEQGCASGTDLHSDSKAI